MSTNINAHLEVKVGGEWHYYSPTNVIESYPASARMAGVDNDDVTPIAPPRGLPEDVTMTTTLHRYNSPDGGYSHSWLSYSEYVELIDWLNKRDPYLKHERTFLGEETFLFGNRVYGWHEDPEEYPEFLEDVRLVFWFD